MFFLRQQQGLTLIELLVAISITAIIGVISATFLSSMINNNSQVRTEEQRLASLERSLQIIRSDIEQLALRPIIQGIDHSDTFVPDFDKSQIIGDESALEFSIFSNQPHTQGIQQSLQRIRYRLTSNKLIRESITTDYPAANQQWQQMVMLNDVNRLSFSYYFTDWESSLAHNKTSPKAIRLEIDTKHISNISLISTVSGVDQ